MGSINFKKFKLFISDLISFGSAQAISINLILIILILAIMPAPDLGYLPVRSLYGSFVIPYIFNNSCPAEGIFANCGFYSIGQTRALSSLLHGDFDSAYGYNKLILILLTALLAVLAFNLFKSYKFHKKTGKIFNY